MEYEDDLAQYAGACEQYLASLAKSKYLAERQQIDLGPLREILGPATREVSRIFAEAGRQELSQQIQSELEKLPPDLRAAITRENELGELVDHWRFWTAQEMRRNGLTFDEIAEQLGISRRLASDSVHAKEVERP